MIGLSMMFNEMWNLFTPHTIFSLIWGTFLGISLGILPGLTASIGIGLLAGLTYHMGAREALLILVAIYMGAIYGGSQSAILFNIPGTPSAAATAIEGHPLAKKGKAGIAIAYATLSSGFGGIFGAFMMAFLTPVLANIALKFQSFDMFLAAIFGIVICGNLTGKHPLKGWIAGALGLLLSFVGLEEIAAYSRFSYGNRDLMGGFSFIPALIGLFGLPEVAMVLKKKVVGDVVTHVGRLLPRIRDLFKHLPTNIRSGIIGVFVGIIPGVGEDIGAWLSYDTAKRLSKDKEKFGTGMEVGVVASETGNNAVIGGAIIPILSLGIPGSAPAAVLMGAIMLHGYRPGPMLMFEQPTLLYLLSAILILAAIATTLQGFLMAFFTVRVLKIPREIMMPIIMMLCVIGTYALNLKLFDLYTMFLFGVIGFALRLMQYPLPPLILGLILGPMVDVELRRAFITTEGNLFLCMQRPTAIILTCMILFLIFSQSKTLKRLVWKEKRVSDA